MNKIFIILVCLLFSVSMAFSIEKVMQDAVDAYERKDYLQAIAGFKELTHDRKDFALGYFYLGNSYYALGSNQEAALNWKLSLKYDKYNTGLYLNLGNAYYNLSNYTEAIKYWKKAVVVDPENYLLWNSIGIYNYAFISNYMESITDFKKAIALKKDFAEPYFHLGNIEGHYRDRPDNAIEYYQLAVKYNPKYAKAYDNMGSAYARKKDIKNTISSFEKSVKYDPNNPRAYYALGSCYLEQKDKKRALKAFQNFLRYAKPDHPKYNEVKKAIETDFK
jgi:tetratricopeptide (TPR) repeat protein